MQIILKTVRGTCSFLSERLFRWQMDRTVKTWTDLVKRTKKFDEKKNKLYRSFQIYQWKIIQCNFSITALMIRCWTVFYDSDMPLLSRVLSRCSFIIATWSYWLCFRQFQSVIRHSAKDMRILDGLIAKLELKPIDRPAKFEFPKLWSVLLHDPENFPDALSAAREALDSQIVDWESAYELMARQVALLRDNKEDISAIDDLKREVDEKRQKVEAERETCKTAALPKGGAGGTLAIEWTEFKSAPFMIDRVKGVVSFGGKWYAVTYEEGIWRSGDCVSWECVEVPIKPDGDLGVVGEALILWGREKNQYAYTFDGNGWKTAEVKYGDWISQKRIVRFGGKWVLAVMQDEDCAGVKGRGVFKRKVKVRSGKTRFYQTDDLAGNWSEIEKMCTEDGWHITPGDIVQSGGKLYARKFADITYWQPLKKVAPDPKNVYLSEIESGWYSSSFGVSNLEEVVRFGDYGCKVDWSGEWMRLTNDGITYGKLYLGERAMRFALGEDTILKVYDRKENPYMRLGRLVPVETAK